MTLLVAAFARVGACMMVMPGLSGSGIPVQVRLYFALGVTVSVVTSVDGPIPVPEDGIAAALLLVRETTVGLFLGLLGRMLLLAAGFIATAMSSLAGYGNIPGTSLEAGEPQAVFGTLITMSTVVLLFQLDFHHLIVRALVSSYEFMPPNAQLDLPGMLRTFARNLQTSFLLALQLGSPFLAYAVIANFAIGIVNKLAPQIPVYFVSLPALIIGGLFLLYVTISSFLMILAQGFLEIYE